MHTDIKDINNARRSIMLKVIFFIVLLGLAGCVAAPQQPIPLDASTLTSQGAEKNLQVGIMMTDIPAPNVFLPGADCLLCRGVAEVNHSRMSKHVDALKPDDFSLVKTDLVSELKEKGVEVVVIDEILVAADLPKNKSEAPNTSNVDFSQYKELYGITHLLVIDIGYLGIERQYASYIPRGDPYAAIGGISYLVDLSDNSYKWYLRINFVKAANGEWDEPPTFPALTNAYYQVIEMAREAIVGEF